MYASLNGSNAGSGSISDPVDIITAVDLVQSGGVIYLHDGIYAMDSLTLAHPEKEFTIQADTGARPVITGTDGYPPSLSVGINHKIKNIWLGGNKFPDENSRVCQIGNGSTVEGCTFWGYSNGFIEGGTAHHNLYYKNRFVNCGFGTLYHDIYIATGTACFDQVIENIHIGGEGYKIHLYHELTNVTVHANFMSNSTCSDLAVQQGDDIISNNILWGNVAYSYWNASNCLVNKNIIGADRIPFSISAENNTNGNVFCNGQDTFGANPAVWDSSAIAANLGYTKAQIDTAISNLITKFAQTTAQVYVDATVEADFAVLRGVINNWKDQ